jgi:uncharacterized protein
MAPAALVLALLGTFMASALIGAVVVAAGGDVGNATGGALGIALNLVQDAAFIGAPLFLAASAIRGPVRPGDFGLRSTPWKSALGWAVLGAIAYYVFSGIWNTVAGPGHKQDDLFESLGVSRGALEVAVLGFLVCVIAPIAEEFLFRGFCFGALKPKLGVLGAAIAVGVTFGLIHIASTPPILLPTLAFLGFVLCLVRWKTGSLYPCIALHALNNSIAFGVLQDWDWQILALAAASFGLIALALAPFRDGALRRDLPAG